MRIWGGREGVSGVKTHSFVFVMLQTCSGASDASVFESMILLDEREKEHSPKDELKMEQPYMMANTVVSNVQYSPVILHFFSVETFD